MEDELTLLDILSMMRDFRVTHMNYKGIEVDMDHGMSVSSGASPLPDASKIPQEDAGLWGPMGPPKFRRVGE